MSVADYGEMTGTSGSCDDRSVTVIVYTTRNVEYP